MGKTKGTEYRVTLNTPGRDWELGSGEQATAKEWSELLLKWIGLPKVERIDAMKQAGDGDSSVVKAQWMELRVDAYKPDEISDEELARSNTMQRSVSSISRTFTLGNPRPSPARLGVTAHPRRSCLSPPPPLPLHLDLGEYLGGSRAGMKNKKKKEPPAEAAASLDRAPSSSVKSDDGEV